MIQRKALIYVKENLNNRRLISGDKKKQRKVTELKYYGFVSILSLKKCSNKKDLLLNLLLTSYLSLQLQK